MKNIDINEAMNIITQEEVIIVDIRNPAAYSEAHIKGAINISDHNVEDFIKNSKKDNPLLCYCYHGHSSQNAAAYFIEEGFKTVYSIAGGFEAWRQIYPYVSGSNE